MRNFALLVVLITCLALPARAQDEYPKVEMFQGFSYLSMDLANRENFFGFQSAFSYNPHKIFGFTGDFGGQFTTISGFTFQNYAYLFGPRFTGRSEKATVFLHALFGGATFRSAFGSESSFAMAFGGGVDLNLGESAAIRIIQADFLQTRFGTTQQDNIRIGFGFVIRIGGG